MVKKENKLIIEEIIKSEVGSSKELEMAKKRIAKDYEMSLPSNMKLLKTYHEMVENKRIKKMEWIEDLLRSRPVRSLSGIVNVSVLTKPYPCPGNCIFCPSQEGIPKSYLDSEPAVMRAVINKFDPYNQTKNRLKALKEMGHPIDKIELRIIGATWTAYPEKYKKEFIKRCFDAANKEKSDNLKEAMKKNEDTKRRIIGIHVETRPDLIDEKEIKKMRELGITGCELGIQSIYNDVLEKNKRGHGIEETIKATKLLKDAGFKISYQVMPNLLGSSKEKDWKMFKEIFSNSTFQPDMIKIYPCMVLKGTELYKKWKEGKFKPYSKKELKSLLKEIKKEIPYYVRVQRIIRDIPVKEIEAGCKVSNLRQIIHQEMEKEDWNCKCIRCREIREKFERDKEIKLFRIDYDASEGKEIFLSFEDKERENIFSLLRLRIPSSVIKKEEHYFPALSNSAIVRQIHTYGRMASINKDKKSSPQHKGMGKKLMKKAEEIAKEEFNLDKIAVISGIGVRGYYKKLNYKLEDTYMIKEL